MEFYLIMSHQGAESFCYKKDNKSRTRISTGLQEKLTLGNLDASRDWGFAKDFVEGMYLMMNYKEADDWVLATGETHTVRDFLKTAFEYFSLNWEDYVLTSERYIRPNEVNHLLGNPSKGKTN